MLKEIPGYIKALAVIATCGLFGYVIRFELLASEVKNVKEKQKKIEEKQNLTAWILCEDAIKKGKEEASKRCKSVLGKDI